VEPTVTNRRGDGHPWYAGPEQGEMAMYCSPGMTATSWWRVLALQTNGVLEW